MTCDYARRSLGSCFLIRISGSLGGGGCQSFGTITNPRVIAPKIDRPQ